MPPAPIPQLGDLTRTAVTRERTREIQRLEKLLEDAGIKLSTVAADFTAPPCGRCWTPCLPAKPIRRLWPTSPRIGCGRKLRN